MWTMIMFLDARVSIHALLSSSRCRWSTLESTRCGRFHAIISLLGGGCSSPGPLCLCASDRRLRFEDWSVESNDEVVCLCPLAVAGCVSGSRVKVATHASLQPGKGACETPFAARSCSRAHSPRSIFESVYSHSHHKTTSTPTQQKEDTGLKRGSKNFKQRNPRILLPLVDSTQPKHRPRFLSSLQ